MSLRKIADYTIIRELGRGGMGAVFQALSPAGATVALKTVTWPEQADARKRWEAIERFQREARAARTLTHPNICQVLDFGADQDTLFIVMEFLDGQSVRELIQSAGAIKAERALAIVTAVCEGLAQAHEHGVVHRDIKPENIMVLRRGQVKLTDFGLASVAAEAAASETGRMVGTLCYLSPEQVRGEPVDARSDIFSLGATFYEMLTGARAFQAEERAAVIHQILTADPPPVPGLPPQVSEALQRCLRKRPQARFQSVQEMLATLTGRAPAPAATHLLEAQQEAPRIITPTPTPSGPLPPIWNVPHRRNPSFTGRDGLLSGIEATLAAGGPAALTQAIVGLGGVGKTQLALEYAYRHAGEYQAIWWVRSEEPSQLAADYAALAVSLDLPEKQAPDQSVMVAAVRRWLERAGGWLLIFDSAPGPASVTDYLPRAGGGHVLITSRDQNWGRTATTVAVPVLPQAEAVALLEKRTGWSGPQVAVLADELGQLPLALEQAAAYAAATGCSLNTYLELFHSRRQALLRREEPPEGYQGTVATTWSLAMVKAGAECPAAAGLLNVCAYLAPDEIPLSLLQEGAEFYPEPLAAAARDPLLLHDAVAALRRYSLVTVHEEALSVNRLVQAVVRDGLREEEQRTWAAAAVRLVNAGFPPNPDDVRNWPGCALRLSHALAATALAMGLLVAAEETAGLLGLAASYLNSRADHEEARACARRALEFVERVLGPEHPAMIWRLEGLAGMGVDTRPLLERALAIAEKVYGADHPEVARRLLPLGAALRWVPDEPGAKACYERALAIAERAEGPEGLLVAEVRLDLSMVLGGLGDFAGAKEQAERALAIFEKTCPPDYGRLASAHMGLGLLSGHLAEFAQEKAHYEQALRIAEKAYGPDHPEVGWRLVTLGRWSLRAFGDLATAKAYQERGLQIYEKAYGPDHPRMGGPLISLAETLRLLGDPGDAKTLVERALAIEGKTWGEQDPESLRLLGSLLLDLGDLQTAPSVLARAQEAAERPDRLDPELKAAVYLEVGRLHHLQGDLEGAKVFLKQSLAIPEAMCPPHQFRMAATHQEYGLTLQALGDPAGAREHLTQAVTMFESQIGPKHPRTQRARRCLAALDTGTN